MTNLQNSSGVSRNRGDLSRAQLHSICIERSQALDSASDMTIRNTLFPDHRPGNPQQQSQKRLDYKTDIPGFDDLLKVCSGVGLENQPLQAQPGLHSGQQSLGQVHGVGDAQHDQPRVPPTGPGWEKGRKVVSYSGCRKCEVNKTCERP